MEGTTLTEINQTKTTSVCSHLEKLQFGKVGGWGMGANKKRWVIGHNLSVVR